MCNNRDHVVANKILRHTLILKKHIQKIWIFFGFTTSSISVVKKILVICKYANIIGKYIFLRVQHYDTFPDYL